MVRQAYLLFHLHHVMPSEFMGMGEGEKLVLAGFLDYEVEEINKAFGGEPQEEEEVDIEWLRSWTSSSR